MVTMVVMLVMVVVVVTYSTVQCRIPMTVPVRILRKKVKRLPLSIFAVTSA